MVMDVVSNSFDKPSIAMSASLMATMNDLKEWLFENVYLKYPVLYPETAKAHGLVIELFEHFCKPGNLPEGFEGDQGAIDYVAGMTDRFAIETYAAIKLPQGFRSPSL